jgi:peroxiredoxin Q/BCP
MEELPMRKLVLVSAVCLSLTAVTARGQQAPTELKVGDAAPAFSLPGTDGKTHTLAEYKGKTVVLAWFPKAFTGG